MSRDKEKGLLHRERVALLKEFDLHLEHELKSFVKKKGYDGWLKWSYTYNGKSDDKRYDFLDNLTREIYKDALIFYKEKEQALELFEDVKLSYLTDIDMVLSYLAHRTVYLDKNNELNKDNFEEEIINKTLHDYYIEHRKDRVVENNWYDVGLF